VSGPCRVLVIDDSPGSRRVLVELLEADGDISVEGRAADGREGLQMLLSLRPDVVTIDLEMPGLDGFALLRLVMAQAPTPVVVISSYAHPADSFRALELGAVDFIPKPGSSVAVELAAYGRELRTKIRAARMARPRPPLVRTGDPGTFHRVIAIGASTGGPPAIQALLQGVSMAVRSTGVPGPSVMICQHMPQHFTAAFAERLSRQCGYPVREATGGELLERGQAYVARGGVHLELKAGPARPVLNTVPRAPSERHAPSVDRLLRSVAAVAGPGALGLVLTGMGDDGAEGARAITAAGGQVWAESEASAVVFGMPRAAVATGAVCRVLSLDELIPALQQLVREDARRREVRPTGA